MVFYLLRHPSEHRPNILRISNNDLQKYGHHQPNVLYLHRYQLLHQLSPLQLSFELDMSFGCCANLLWYNSNPQYQIVAPEVMFPPAQAQVGF